MSDPRSPDMLGGLPRTRPHRRSAKRGAAPVNAGGPTDGPATLEAAGKASPARAKAVNAKASGTKGGRTASRSKSSPGKRAPSRAPAAPAAARSRAPRRAAPPARPQPKPAPGADVLGTAVQAAAELAEIGLTVGARAVRGVIQRLPRP